MRDEQNYREWLESKQTAKPSEDLADRIMQAVADREVKQRAAVLLRLAVRLEQSRFAPYMACGFALLVGATPFVYLALVAQVIVF